MTLWHVNISELMTNFIV